MWIFTHLDKELKQAIKLLSLGTFLEYFDLLLYAHMAVLLNDLFFPPADTRVQSLLAAFSFCSSLIFRPLGAIIFGYIGDKYGRKATVVITTFIMAITCLVMANAPTYSQIGLAAAWIITICRILQGISSMGEVIGAQLFLMESTPLPVRFPVVGLVYVFADLGGVFALIVANLATFSGFNWRIAFMLGTCIAFVGTVARNKLRESPEFGDATRRLEGVFKSINLDNKVFEKSPFYIYGKKVSKKTLLSYFLINCPGSVIIYFVYFYGGTILKDVFNYSAHQVLIHNLLLALVQLVGLSMLRTYLSNKIHPLKMLSFICVIISLFIPCLPWLLNHISAFWQLFLVQSFLLIFMPTEFPAVPIFLKNFPVFKRFSYASFLYALARAVIYIIISFGLTYLVSYFGYWGLLVLMVPVLIGYGYGLRHFIKLERSAGRYPKLMTWQMG